MPNDFNKQWVAYDNWYNGGINELCSKEHK